MRIGLASMVLLLSPAALAQSLPGDTWSGRNLALRICSDWHVVAEDQARPTTDSAPPFAAVVRDVAVTALSLRAFLQTSHKDMPNLVLSPAETDDLVSYMLSIRSIRR